jgi:hypothetical protein
MAYVMTFSRGALPRPADPQRQHQPRRCTHEGHRTDRLPGTGAYKTIGSFDGVASLGGPILNAVREFIAKVFQSNNGLIRCATHKLLLVAAANNARRWIDYAWALA